jgi:hypothetical protein
MYAFQLPKTHEIHFEDYLLENSIVTPLIIRQFAGTRERIRHAIKNNELDEILQAIPLYIPYALSLEFFNGVSLPIKNRLMFTWKSAVGLKDKRGEFLEMQYDDARCEVAFTLFVRIL